MDDLHEYIHAVFTDPVAIERAEVLMAEQADTIAQIVSHVAMYLHQFLLDMPMELQRSNWEPEGRGEGYAFMRVHEINDSAKIAILTSDTTHP